MLRLLAQREQGYEDIAALMGLSVDEVRARVGEALAQLETEGAEPPAMPAPEPEPEPPAPEPAPEPEPPEPEPPREPEPPSPRPEPAVAAPTAKAPPGGRPRLSLPSENGPRAAIAAGLAAVVAIVVVLLVGGGDEGSGTASAGGEGAPAGSAADSDSAEETRAVLSPVGASGASGEATFGRVEDSLALQVEAEGLQPTGDGQEYTIWLSQSPQRMLPLASTKVDSSGEIEAQFEIPVEILAYLANETFDQIAVTRTDTKRLQASLAKATQETKAPGYTGTEVMRGEVIGPIVGAQLREEEE